MLLHPAHYLIRTPTSLRPPDAPSHRLPHPAYPPPCPSCCSQAAGRLRPAPRAVLPPWSLAERPLPAHVRRRGMCCDVLCWPSSLCLLLGLTGSRSTSCCHHIQRINLALPAPLSATLAASWPRPCQAPRRPAVARAPSQRAARAAGDARPRPRQTRRETARCLMQVSVGWRGGRAVGLCGMATLQLKLGLRFGV